MCASEIRRSRPTRSPVAPGRLAYGDHYGPIPSKVNAFRSRISTLGTIVSTVSLGRSKRRSPVSGVIVPFGHSRRSWAVLRPIETASAVLDVPTFRNGRFVLDVGPLTFSTSETALGAVLSRSDVPLIRSAVLDVRRILGRSRRSGRTVLDVVSRRSRRPIMNDRQSVTLSTSSYT